MARAALVVATLAVALGVAWLAAGAPPPWWPPAEGVAADMVVVIPRGADAAHRRGAPIWSIPIRLDVRRGQSVVVRNDDAVTHPFLGVALAPGQTLRRTFPTPGRYYFNAAEVAGIDCELDDDSQLMAIVVQDR